MSIPDYQSLMLPVLSGAAKCERSVPELSKDIADTIGLSQSEQDQMLVSGRQRVLHNRVHWAKFYLTKAGLIDPVSRGIFKSSVAGNALLATNPAKISVETLKSFPQFMAFY